LARNLRVTTFSKTFFEKFKGITRKANNALNSFKEMRSRFSPFLEEQEEEALRPGNTTNSFFAISRKTGGLGKSKSPAIVGSEFLCSYSATFFS